MQWQDVCLSVYVCPSVIRQYSVKTAKHIVELFLPFGRHTILVFPCHTLRQYFDGDPLTWLSNARGYEKTTIFDQYFAISETIQNTASYYGMRLGNLTQAFEWYHLQLSWVTPTQISRSRHYLSLNIWETAWDTDKFNGVVMGTYKQQLLLLKCPDYNATITQLRGHFTKFIRLFIPTPYSKVLFRMTWVIFNYLAKYSMTRSIARYLCDSWASYYGLGFKFSGGIFQFTMTIVTWIMLL